MIFHRAYDSQMFKLHVIIIIRLIVNNFSKPRCIRYKNFSISENPKVISNYISCITCHVASEILSNIIGHGSSHYCGDLAVTAMELQDLLQRECAADVRVQNDQAASIRSLELFFEIDQTSGSTHRMCFAKVTVRKTAKLIMILK
jgi:hypothetical protein